jgi:hypothetical protein
MKTYEGVEVRIYAFLTSGLERESWRKRKERKKKQRRKGTNTGIKEE